LYKRLRYREAIVAIGEIISVLGSGTREPDPQAAPADYRGGQPTLIRLTSSPRYPLVISDDPSTTRRDRHRNGPRSATSDVIACHHHAGSRVTRPVAPRSGAIKSAV
jgi:hypothetical protein